MGVGGPELAPFFVQLQSAPGCTQRSPGGDASQGWGGNASCRLTKILDMPSHRMIRPCLREAMGWLQNASKAGGKLGFRRVGSCRCHTSVLTSAPRPTTKPSARSRRRGVRLRENPGSSCQAATRRLEVLSGLHKKCKSSRVLGSVNSWWFSRDAGAQHMRSRGRWLPRVH